MDMQINKIGILGAGTIGLSWASLFLAKNKTVVIYDIAPNIEAIATKQIQLNLAALNVPYESVADQLQFIDKTDQFDHSFDWIQENGPEKLDIKQAILAELEATIRPDCIIASSSSGIIPTLSAEKMTYPERLIIGHPFNPPHLIPLVEVVPGKKTSQATIDQTMAFYESIGKKPVLIQKEISGFVANRLQVAIFEECIYLVKEGVVSPEDLDTIVESSLGIRWATDGPYKSFHMGGGSHGFRGFMQHLGPNMNQGFKDRGTVELDEALRAQLSDLVEKAYGTDMTRLEEKRDTKQAAILETLSKF